MPCEHTSDILVKGTACGYGHLRGRLMGRMNAKGEMELEDEYALVQRLFEIRA